MRRCVIVNGSTEWSGEWSDWNERRAESGVSGEWIVECGVGRVMGGGCGVEGRVKQKTGSYQSRNLPQARLQVQHAEDRQIPMQAAASRRLAATNHATCRKHVCKCSTQRTGRYLCKLPQAGDWQLPITLPGLQVQHTEDWQLPITQSGLPVQHTEAWQLPITQPGCASAVRKRLAASDYLTRFAGAEKTGRYQQQLKHAASSFPNHAT